MNRYQKDRTSMVDSLLAAATENTSELIFMVNHRKTFTYTYQDIWNGSLSFAKKLKRIKLAIGETVIMVLPTSAEFQFCFYGTLLAGGIPVPIATPPFGGKNMDYYLERIEAILENSQAKTIVAEKTDVTIFQEKLHLDTIKYSFIDVMDCADDTSEEDFIYHQPNAEDICFIQYTSGSTNNKPKGVPLTHRNIMANIEGIAAAVAVQDVERGLSWMPLYHDMGLIGGMLLPLHFNFEKMVFLNPILLAKPILWLKAISDHKATISPGNNFSFHHCVKKVTEQEKKQLDLSNWRVAFNGSEPIDINIIRDFSTKFQDVGFKKDTMTPCYGLAEATLGVTFPSAEEKVKVVAFNHENLFVGSKVTTNQNVKKANQAIQLLSLGKPANCVEVGIFDQDGNHLEETYIGRICVKGLSVIKGYYSTDWGSLPDIKEDWLVTGDIGFLYEGNLYFVGREKELVVIRGKNYSAVDIETLLRGELGAEFSCAACGYFDTGKSRECLGIVFESEETDPTILAQLKNKIQKIVMQYFGIYADMVIPIPLKSIPKTMNGKVRRMECIQLFASTK
jgi:acyl-CoA synthetase (AMP-forming)/AMP-acid ligase II